MYKINQNNPVQTKMPKNNKVITKNASCSHFRCACGVYKEYNDYKSMMSARNRHIKYCEEGQKSEWLQNNGRMERLNENTGRKEIIETDEWKIRMAIRKL